MKGHYFLDPIKNEIYASVYKNPPKKGLVEISEDAYNKRKEVFFEKAENLFKNK